MTIRKIIAIQALLVLLGGLLLAGGFFAAFLDVGERQAEVASAKIADNDLERLGDAARNWIVLNDLVYGSGETYLAEGAEQAGLHLVVMVKQLRERPAAAKYGSALRIIADLAQQNEKRLKQATRASSTGDSARLISDWDQDAGRVVEKIEVVQTGVRAFMEDSVLHYQKYRTMVMVIASLCSLLFLLGVVASWLWLSRMIVEPISGLTRSADQALRLGQSFAFEVRGPQEAQALAHSMSAFVNELEARVRSRTRDLQQREEDLLDEIKHRHQAERSANEAREAAESASEAKSEFLANMSHEIRTPLNGILGSAELLLQTERNKADSSRINTLIKSGHHLLDLINGILDFSKLEVGRLELDACSFDLREFLTDIANIFEPQAAAKQLGFFIDVDTDIPRRLIGDELRLRQILTNLLGNAFKFTSSGEVVLRVKLNGLSGDNIIVLWQIADTGTGISPEHQAVIFEPFTQADSSTTRKFGGTGLGLNISQHLTQLMGGSLSCESHCGQGSVFTATVCLKLDCTDSRPLYDEPTLPASNALVMIDSIRLRDAAIRLLLQAGVRISGSESGADAAATSTFERSEHIDLVVADAQNATTALEICSALPDCERRFIELRTGGIGAEIDSPDNFVQLSNPLLADELFCLVQEPADMDESPQAKLPAQPTVRAGLEILVAEDNAVNQEVIRAMLETFGCHVTIAEDGDAALQAFSMQVFDLVFMDWHMPKMDGLQATQAIREQEAQAGPGRIPIIALTANALEQHAQLCLSAGMDAYLTKPVAISALADTLTHWCSTPRKASAQARQRPSLSATDL